MDAAHGMIDTLVEDVTMECRTPGGRVGQLDAALSYDSTDPFAVTVLFRTRDGVVPWAFSRDMLERGVTEPVGDGDVRLRPGVDRAGHAVVVIDLSSDEGGFTAQARTRDVMGFLARTFALVPVGTEHHRLDLDRLVVDLLG